MPRYAAVVEYMGAAYMGWQRQAHGPSVQATLERALSKIATEPVTTICAGRTDTGVHAFGQVVHFDTRVTRKPHEWERGANSLLPADVSVRHAMRVEDTFHARFSALTRRYQYWILNQPLRSAIFSDRSFHIPYELDVTAMRSAGRALLGEHDFSTFRAAGCQAKSPVRDIRALRVDLNERWICVEVVANGFLQRMVRNIVGTLVAVGRGEIAAAAVSDLLNARDRTAAPFAAPAHGLYFCEASYQEDFGLPNLSAEDAQLPFSPVNQVHQET